jgi:hypothetical protein
MECRVPGVAAAVRRIQAIQHASTDAARPVQWRFSTPV